MLQGTQTVNHNLAERQLYGLGHSQNPGAAEATVVKGQPFSKNDGGPHPSFSKVRMGE